MIQAQGLGSCEARISTVRILTEDGYSTALAEKATSKSYQDVTSQARPVLTPKSTWYVVKSLHVE